MKQPVLKIEHYSTDISEAGVDLNPTSTFIVDSISCDVRVGIENIKDVFDGRRNH